MSAATHRAAARYAGVMVAVAGCEKPDPIVNDEEESALRVTSSPFIISLTIFSVFFSWF
jgi:hypothetical protein